MNLASAHILRFAPNDDFDQPESWQLVYALLRQIGKNVCLNSSARMMRILLSHRYEKRAEQHLAMARRAICRKAQMAHLNLASHLATEAEILRDAREPAVRCGPWLADPSPAHPAA
jgi:hypothetical protein